MVSEVKRDWYGIKQVYPKYQIITNHVSNVNSGKIQCQNQL